jgi:hypothetical protein
MVARSLGWKVHMRCANGYRQETRSIRRCVYRKQLDRETLVATRGPKFPLSRVESHLMCPACGNRRVTVVFEPRAMRRFLVDGCAWCLRQNSTVVVCSSAEQGHEWAKHL